VRFEYSSSGSGRVQMRERQSRDRAAMPDLRSRFPQFSALRLTFEFSGKGPFTPASQLAVLHPPAPAYFVFPCPYSDCSGEFDLSIPIASMATDRRGSCAGRLHCSGQRNLDSRIRAQCTLMLEFHVEANPA
jgi:hypothetical protein